MKEIAILLAEGFEEIEAITPIDFLRRALLSVIVVGVGSKKIRGSHDIVVESDVLLNDYNAIPAAVVVPGGMPGAQNISDSDAAIDLLKSVIADEGIVAAICAAPAVVLARHGFLDGRRATCYPGFEKLFTATEFSKERVVWDGNFLTSRGPGTAAEFALALVEHFSGTTVRTTLHEGTIQPSA